MTVRTGGRDRKRRVWWTMGVVTALLGVVAVVTGAYLQTHRGGGLSWHAGIGYQSDGASTSATATIRLEDGTSMSFTGEPAAAESWLAEQEDRMRRYYGAQTKDSPAEALLPVGLVLLTLGSVILFWRLLVGRAERKPALDETG